MGRDGDRARANEQFAGQGAPQDAREVPDAGECRGKHGADGTAEGVLCYGGTHWPLSGRALRLMVWLAGQQPRINAVVSEQGQLWITWKGNGPHSIDGEVRARLASE